MILDDGSIVHSVRIAQRMIVFECRGTAVFAADKPARRGLYPSSLPLSLTSAADDSGSGTKAYDWRVPLRWLIPVSVSNRLWCEEDLRRHQVFAGMIINER